ncbi:MAG: class I SAM-dependent methyltransferase [Methanothrix sp.]|nr:class I SAM-dependent methyltransferase [Methanothrix sp.]
MEGILILSACSLKDRLIQLIERRRSQEAIGLALTYFNNKPDFRRIAGLMGQNSGLFGRLLWQFEKLNARICYRKYSDGLNRPFCDILGKSNFDNYLKDRFSAESLWSLYPFIQMLKGYQERVLDLSCGAGHSSFILSANIKPKHLFCADYNFRNLSFARNYMAKEADYFCIDASYPLPFADGIFSSVLMMDAFHSIPSRASLAKEMERVVSPQGLLLLLHEHSSLYRHYAYGHLLPPSGWARLFQRLPVRVLSEKSVVEDFLSNDLLDLKRESSPADLNRSMALTIVGCRDSSAFRIYRDLWKDILNNKNKLIINPIYNIKQVSGKLILKIKYPSDYFRLEYPLTEKYLPEQCQISSDLAEAFKGRFLNIDYSIAPNIVQTEIDYLMKKFVIISVPKKYCRLNPLEWSLT